MDVTKISSQDAQTVRNYIEKKFKIFDGWRYPKSVRTKKCINYWIAAGNTRHGRAAIEAVYYVTFKEVFPVQKAKLMEEAALRSTSKVTPDEWVAKQEKRLRKSNKALTKLEGMKSRQDYQLGESFFLDLKEAVSFLDDNLFDEDFFSTEFETKRVMDLTGRGDREGWGGSAEFDAMIGFKQTAGVKFQATLPRDWGRVTGILEEEFKAGVWARGEAKAKMNKLGFSAEAQAAIAIGLQLDVSGSLTWEKGKAGLKLDGSAQAFGGAMASFEGKISGKARGNFEASIKAECFAGFKAECSGSCSFLYEGRSLVSASASVEVSVGAGASFEASIKSSLFGPTAISVESSLTLGVGGGTAATLEIDFDGILLAGRSEFKRAVYLPTLAKGYRMDLIDSDARNLFYLNKCLGRLKDEVSTREGLIGSLQDKMSKNIEKVPLLMSAEL